MRNCCRVPSSASGFLCQSINLYQIEFGGAVILMTNYVGTRNGSHDNLPVCELFFLFFFFLFFPNSITYHFPCLSVLLWHKRQGGGLFREMQVTITINLIPHNLYYTVCILWKIWGFCLFCDWIYWLKKKKQNNCQTNKILWKYYIALHEAHDLPCSTRLKITYFQQCIHLLLQKFNKALCYLPVSRTKPQRVSLYCWFGWRDYFEQFELASLYWLLWFWIKMQLLSCSG